MTDASMNTPHQISNAEWKEIMEIPSIKQSWGREGTKPRNNLLSLRTV